MRHLFRFTLAVLLVACNSSGPPGPSPLPTPEPTPEPTPAPRLLPSWNGTSWSPPLRGAVICCDDPATPGVDEGLRDGWPLAHPEVLEELARLGANATHFRTGPFLDPEEAPLSTLRERVALANSLGMWVEVDLIDAWVLRNGLSPWGETCKATRGAFKPHHKAHVEAVVRAVADLPGVSFQTGNELPLCRPKAGWEASLIQAARDAGARVVGSPLGRGDYLTIHEFRPTMVGELLNESDGTEDPKAWVDLSKASPGSLLFWRGEMSDTYFLGTLPVFTAVVQQARQAPPRRGTLTGVQPEPEEGRYGRENH